MKTYVCVLAFTSLISMSCDRKDATEVATEHFLKFEAMYQSEDVRQAEHALLKYRREVLEAQQQGKQGINYDQALAIADARLFVLYEEIGQTDKANQCFAQSVDAFKRVAAKAQREPPEFSRATLRESIEKFDRGLTVRWKRPKVE